MSKYSSTNASHYPHDDLKISSQHRRGSGPCTLIKWCDRPRHFWGRKKKNPVENEFEIQRALRYIPTLRISKHVVTN